MYKWEREHIRDVLQGNAPCRDVLQGNAPCRDVPCRNVLFEEIRLA